MNGRPSYEDAAAATLINPDVPREIWIWRYLDLGKFLSLLHTRSLYFSRVDSLEDELEGSPTADEVATVEAFLKDYPNPRGLRPLEMAKVARRWVHVSCWHENEGESRAMWKMYGREDNTVAIVSTPLRLAKAVLGVAGSYVFSVISKVHYIDHWKDHSKAIANAAVVAPFVHKDRAYAYENEVRAVLCEQQWINYDPHVEPTSRGVHVPVVLEDLITQIVLPPNSPLYIEEAITGIMTSSFGLNIPVIRSRLERVGKFEDTIKP